MKGNKQAPLLDVACRMLVMDVAGIDDKVKLPPDIVRIRQEARRLRNLLDARKDGEVTTCMHATRLAGSLVEELERAMNTANGGCERKLQSVQEVTVASYLTILLNDALALKARLMSMKGR